MLIPIIGFSQDSSTFEIPQKALQEWFFIIAFLILVSFLYAGYKLFKGGKELKNKNIKDAGIFLLIGFVLQIFVGLLIIYFLNTGYKF